MKSLDVVYFGIETDKWEEVKEFYQEKLGLQKHIGGDEMGWIEFKVSPDHTTSIAISRLGQEQNVQPGSGGIPVFMVEDLEVSILRLRKQGVEFLGDLNDDGMIRLIRFRDPCGNTLQLVECH